MFIIQQLNQVQGTLYPHRFIHIIQLHNQYTCDCRHAQSGEPCVHEVMLRDSMLDFSTKCPYDETAPEAELDSNGERVYVSQNNQVVPVCCFATGEYVPYVGAAGPIVICAFSVEWSLHLSHAPQTGMCPCPRNEIMAIPKGPIRC